MIDSIVELTPPHQRATQYVSSAVSCMKFRHQTGEIGATRDDKLVMMEKIAQRAIVKIEERSQNNGILIDGWRG